MKGMIARLFPLLTQYSTAECPSRWTFCRYSFLAVLYTEHFLAVEPHKHSVFVEKSRFLWYNIPDSITLKDCAGIDQILLVQSI